MKNNEEQKSDGTSTPEPQGNTGDAMGLAVFEFPRVQDVAERAIVNYGDKLEVLRVSDNTTVEIDAYFFASSTGLKLKKIKPCLAGLKKSGVKLLDGKEIDAAWFNAHVRDPFHKVLKYAAQQSLKYGEPVGVGFTRRTNKTTGEQTVTAKHAFEFITKAPKVTAIADEAAKLAEKSAKEAAKETAKSEARARRQAAKAAKITPVVSPENVERLDALKADLSKAEAAAA